MPHLFVDISSHGFGHLAQSAPILGALLRRRPDLRLSIRSGLPRERIAERLPDAFAHLPGASDFGFAMLDPLRVDRPETARRYRTAHAEWDKTVGVEAALLNDLGADFVFSNASYLPLAGAARAGIPAACCCSLNWRDLFEHFFGDEPWGPDILAQIGAAYDSAPFLALEPAMPMGALREVRRLPPVAETGTRRRAAIEQRHPGLLGKRLVLVGFGGIAMNGTRFDVAAWARRARTNGAACGWLVPDGWGDGDPDCIAVGPLGLSYSDLQASCDAAIGKPGYGTFVEAARSGVPVLWVRREDWPEQDCLVDWLTRHGTARQLLPAEITAGTVPEALADLWSQARPPPPAIDGAAAVAAWLDERLGALG